ncbi:uncharacterized protein LOC100180427 [Ciona intestinalis]
MSEKAILLRRPRPPKNTSKFLPPIPSDRSQQTNYSIKNASPEMLTVPSSMYDGLQSPVPTMQSEYEPTISPGKRKAIRKTASYATSTDDTAGDTGGTWSKKGLVLPYKPRGPDPFPIRQPRHPLEVRQEYVLPDDSYYNPTAEFSLDDFLLNNKNGLPPRPAIRKTILSRANYQKLTRLLKDVSENKDVEQTVQVAKINISDQFEIQPKQKRVPRRQVLLEMKKIVQERLNELGLTSPSRLGTSDKLSDVVDEIQEMGEAEGVSRKSAMSIFVKATEKIFQGTKRSGSPFEEDGAESIITPSELAILNCLIEGGFVLSLKAHFIAEVPDLSPLAQSLIYLNLSFNEFSEFPREVLYCRELQVLKFRDNPLKDIPSDISRLHKLRTLILSFCCISALPVSVFSIKTLEFLDVSYNKLTFLSNEVKNLENLRFLNVEGNELPGLPCGLLKLNLFRIRVQNNFMSALFWKENSNNNPQRLTDLTSLKLQQSFIQGQTENYLNLPQTVAHDLSNHNYCDCCRGPMYGPGLRIIRPCSEIWGIKRIPFIFRSCSPSCYSDFISNVDPKVSEMIYGIKSEQLLNSPSRASCLSVP